MSAFQYTAHCRNCGLAKSLTRDQIDTGRNPICEACGDAMVVWSSTSGRRAEPALEVDNDPQNLLRRSEGH